MRSPGHRHNILSRRFREIGIGVKFDTPVGSYATGATYTTTFGARSGSRQSRVARSTSRLKLRVGTPAVSSRAAKFVQFR